MDPMPHQVLPLSRRHSAESNSQPLVPQPETQVAELSRFLLLASCLISVLVKFERLDSQEVPLL